MFEKLSTDIWDQIWWPLKWDPEQWLDKVFSKFYDNNKFLSRFLTHTGLFHMLYGRGNDTVDHTILLGRLQSLLGLRGNALSWFQSYLNGRTQRISVDGTLSDKFELECGVPQGSCLGPLLFTIYVRKLFDIIRLHLPFAHAFADDTQLYMSFKPSDTLSEFEAVAALENCIHDVRAWMKEDMLWLNDRKTEFLLIGSRQHQGW